LGSSTVRGLTQGEPAEETEKEIPAKKEESQKRVLPNTETVSRREWVTVSKDARKLVKCRLKN
jgi:hypothetical protein